MLLSELYRLERDRLITLRPHDAYPYIIANYTDRTQYGDLWDRSPLLRHCRGLVVDTGGNVLARPFPKFFNLEEPRAEIPFDSGFSVSPKLDGSLVIVFHAPHGEWLAATRGAFASPQALEASTLLRERYSQAISELDPSCTYLFELCSPSVRSIIRHDSASLVLLAVYRTSDGVEQWPTPSLSGVPSVPYEGPYESLQSFFEALEPALANDLKKLDPRGVLDTEGFVLRFDNGQRVKLKTLTYIQVARAVNHLSVEGVLRLLAARSFEDYVRSLPDELQREALEIAQRLRDEYDRIRETALEAYRNLYDDDRKTFASRAIEHPYASILFAMYSRKNIERHLWNAVKREFDRRS